MLESEFWLGKKVLVTGHTGFKGGWLSLILNHLGARVSGLSLQPNDHEKLFGLLDLEAKIDSHFVDMRDRWAIFDTIRACQPELVFHLAAQPLVNVGYMDPHGTFDTNVMGLVNLLDACLESSALRGVLVITSDKCYENDERIWAYRESDRMGGSDPYSCSKGCAELIVECYRKSYFGDAGIPLAAARAGNVFGGGDFTPGRLLPDIVDSYLQAKPLKLRNASAVRPWQHVLEPLGGYLLLMEKMFSDLQFDSSGGWNFGPDYSQFATVKEFVAEVTQVFALNDVKVGSDNFREASRLTLDSTKARIQLGWEPVYGLREAMILVGDWISAYESGSNLSDVTLKQFDEYCHRLLNKCE